MKRSLFILGFALMASVVGVKSQNYTGLLANVDGLTMGDMANYSQSQFQFGTARSMAMGGALSSLGADASAMATNPAGLGMYRHSEFTITPIVTAQKSENSAVNYQDNSQTTFALGNVAFIIAIPQSDPRSKLLGFSLGFGYNRIADLNYNTSFFQSSLGRETSIGQFFANQLNNSGISLSQVSGDDNPNWNDSNITTDIWGAILGYKSGLVDWDSGSGSWSAGWIGDNADIGHFVGVESRGSIGEYEFSFGANVENKLYIGATLGVTTLHQKINYYYSEDYIYPQGPTSDYEINYSHYNQTAIVDGVGVNFKLGVIYRPIEALRLSLAVHTPTAYTIEREYQAAAAGSVYVNTSTPDSGINPDSNGNAYFEATSPILYDSGEYAWAFKTPARMIFGASYMIGNRALLSVDYQCDWYNGIRMTSAPTGINIYDYKSQAKSYFQRSNTLRVGGEFRVTPGVALRAGYGFTDSIIKGENVAYSPISPTIESVHYISAGVGFSVNKTLSIDFAYMYHKTDYTDFQLYGLPGGDIYNLDIVRHNIAMTTTFKF